MKDDPCNLDPVILNYGPEPDPIMVAAYIEKGFNQQQAYEMAQDKMLAKRITGILDGKPPFDQTILPKKEWMP